MNSAICRVTRYSDQQLQSRFRIPHFSNRPSYRSVALALPPADERLDWANGVSQAARTLAADLKVLRTVKQVNVIFSVWRTDISHAVRLFSLWLINLQYQSEVASYRLQLCNGSVQNCCTQFKHLQKHKVMF